MCILYVRVKINKPSFEPFCVWIWVSIISLQCSQAGSREEGGGGCGGGGGGKAQRGLIFAWGFVTWTCEGDDLRTRSWS